MLILDGLMYSLNCRKNDIELWKCKNRKCSGINNMKKEGKIKLRWIMTTNRRSQKKNCFEIG